MAYISYEQYKALGGGADEPEFAKREPFAESVMDSVTLNRLKDPRSLKGDADVWQRAFVTLIESVPSILDGFDGSKSPVTSFSNGIDSFSFANAETGTNPALESAKAQLSLMLPVELISADVSYNYAS